MIHKTLKWLDDNADRIIQVYSFGVAIALAIGMMSLGFVLK